MPVNPFDGNYRFTCPRCGSHSFECIDLGRVRCMGGCSYVGKDTRNTRGDAGDAATHAFNEIAKLCGVPEWDYPGQIIRDVQHLKKQLNDVQDANRIHADLNGELSRRLQNAQVERDAAASQTKALEHALREVSKARDWFAAEVEAFRAERDTLVKQCTDLLERLRKHEPNAMSMDPFTAQEQLDAVEEVRVERDNLKRKLARLVKACGLGRDEIPCGICGKPAVCLGTYNDAGKMGYACIECCGHGCEDGFCVAVEYYREPEISNK